MSKLKKSLGIVLIALFIFIVGSFGFYGYWNSAAPDRTCASCHEIVHSIASWNESAHRDVRCIECHGTALSNGIHSLREKARMVFKHYTREQFDEIRLTEKHVLEMNQTCRKCHHSEYVGWRSGGHSVNYEHIFLDESQNINEQLNYDCLRCHGMFYEGNIHSLIEPINTEGPWKLKEPSKAIQPVIPCLVCHKIHEPGYAWAEHDYNGSHMAHHDRLDVTDSFYSIHKERQSKAGFYDRNSKQYLNASMLPKPAMWHNEREVKVSDDPLMRLCIQCHAPDVWKQVGSADDRTPVGVHEGISCLACHSNHSNSSLNSCMNCHPGISNCGLDVRTMNTTYAFKDSPNNIHFLSCKDCHDENFHVLK